jgi:hypothetical protein
MTLYEVSQHQRRCGGTVPLARLLAIAYTALRHAMDGVHCTKFGGIHEPAQQQTTALSQPPVCGSSYTHVRNEWMHLLASFDL